MSYRKMYTILVDAVDKAIANNANTAEKLKQALVKAEEVYIEDG